MSAFIGILFLFFGYLQEGAKYVAKVKAIYAFNVTHGPEGRTERWVVDVKNGNGSVQKGSKGKGLSRLKKG